MLSLTRLSAGVLVACVFVAPASAQVDPDAQAVLKDASAAIRSATSIRYRGVRTMDSTMFAQLNSTMEGDVRLLRNTVDPAGSAVRITGKGSRGMGEGEQTFDVSYDARWVSWVDEKAKVVNEKENRPRSDGEKARKFPAELLLKEFVEPDPMNREIAAPRIVMEEARDIDGTLCRVVRAGDAQGDRESVWYISAVDNLPRRVERIVGKADRRTTQTLDLKGLATEPALKLDDLKITPPQGFLLQSDRDEKEGAAADPTQPPSGKTLLPGEPIEGVGLAPGTPAPGFELVDLAGKPFNASAFSGKTALIAFGSSWSRSSIAAAAALQDLARNLESRGVMVVQVASRELVPTNAATAWNAAAGSVPVLVDAGDGVMKAYNVRALPSFCVIGRDGKVARFFHAFPGKEKLAAAIEESIAGSQAQR